MSLLDNSNTTAFLAPEGIDLTPRLRLAADYISQHGWTRWTMRADDGAVCLMGAVQYALSNGDPDFEYTPPKAVWEAAMALAARDQISQAAYDALTTPWRRVVGPIHPDDPSSMEANDLIAQIKK